MKRVKGFVKKYWFLKVILPYMMRNSVECSAYMKDSMVLQLYKAKVGFYHINKWLKWLGEDEIKGYALLGRERKQIKMFYKVPSADERRLLDGEYRSIN